MRRDKPKGVMSAALFLFIVFSFASPPPAWLLLRSCRRCPSRLAFLRQGRTAESTLAETTSDYGRDKRLHERSLDRPGERPCSPQRPTDSERVCVCAVARVQARGGQRSHGPRTSQCKSHAPDPNMMADGPRRCDCRDAAAVRGQNAAHVQRRPDAGLCVCTLGRAPPWLTAQSRGGQDARGRLGALSKKKKSSECQARRSAISSREGGGRATSPFSLCLRPRSRQLPQRGRLQAQRRRPRRAGAGRRRSREGEPEEGKGGQMGLPMAVASSARFRPPRNNPRRRVYALGGTAQTAAPRMAALEAGPERKAADAFALATRVPLPLVDTRLASHVKRAGAVSMIGMTGARPPCARGSRRGLRSGRRGIAVQRLHPSPYAAPRGSSRDRGTRGGG